MYRSAVAQACGFKYPEVLILKTEGLKAYLFV